MGDEFPKQTCYSNNDLTWLSSEWTAHDSSPSHQPYLGNPLKIPDSLALGVNPWPPRGQYSLWGGNKAGAHECSHPRTQGFGPVAGLQHIRVLAESHPPCWEPKAQPLTLSTSISALPSQSLPRLHPYSLDLSWAAWQAPSSLATVWHSLYKTDSPTSLQGQLDTTSPESLRIDPQIKVCQSHSMGPKPPLTLSQLRCPCLASCPSRHSHSPSPVGYKPGCVLGCWYGQETWFSPSWEQNFSAFVIIIIRGDYTAKEKYCT